MRYAWLLLALGVALGGPRVALAESTTEFAFVTLPGCPDQREAQRLVEDALGAPLFQPREQQLKLSAVVIQKADQRYHLVLTTTSQSGVGTRELADADCQRLVNAAALIMALAIDPERTEARARERQGLLPESGGYATTTAPIAPPPSPRPVDTAQPPRAAPRADQPTATRPRSTPPTAWRPVWAVLAELSGGVGVLPNLHAKMALGGGVEPTPEFGLRVLGELWLPSEASIDDSPASIQMSLLSAGADACWLSSQDSLRAYVCVGARLGRMQGRGQGLEHSHTETALWSAAVAELGLATALGKGFSAFGALAPGLSLERPRFGVAMGGQGREIFRPALGLLEVGLGVSRRIP